VFSFVSPVIVAIVAQAILILGKSALIGKGKGPMLWAVAAGAVVAVILGMNELLVLACAGLVMAAAGASSLRGNGPGIQAIAPSAGLVIGAGAAATASATPGAIFWIFAKIGSVLFGSGYVLLAFLQAEFVERRGWLTQQQMIDSVAVGQFTPGPVFTTATFIGYLLGGLPGAGAATLGIFSPAFLFVAITAPLLPRLRQSRVLAAALDGVNAASLALMAVVMVQLARSCLNSWWSIAMAIVALGLLSRTKVNSAWLVLGSVLLAIAAMMVR
jgi:chromate transporter